MDYSIIETICNEYFGNYIPCIKCELSESEKKFIKKYIKPEIKKNFNLGIEMEAMFNDAFASASQLSFINGFKTCMRLIFECLEET